MIIGFGGRICSGKTKLSQLTKDMFGGRRLYFALPLKELCCKLISTDLETFDTMKRNNDTVDFKITDSVAETIANETGIDARIVSEWGKNVEFHTPRDMVQLIGTDLIRNNNVDWHVNKIREMIGEIGDENVFIDDVRFPNEKKLIEDLGGDVWYVVRPLMENISNHESETSLTWHDCYPNVIVNNRQLSTLWLLWSYFFMDYTNNKRERQYVMDNIQEYWEAPSALDRLLISEDMFSYTDIRDRLRDVKKVYDKKGYAILEFNDGTHFCTPNALILEDIKVIL